MAELKAARLLTDTGTRERRVKVYQLNRHGEEALADAAIHKPIDCFSPEYIPFQPYKGTQPPPLRVMPSEVLTPHAREHWQFYYFTIQCNLNMFDGKNGRPLLQDVYVSLTQHVTGKNTNEIWRNLFDSLYAAPYYWPCRFSHTQEQGANLFEWLEGDELARAKKAIEEWEQSALADV